MHPVSKLSCNLGAGQCLWHLSCTGLEDLGESDRELNEKEVSDFLTQTKEKGLIPLAQPSDYGATSGLKAEGGHQGAHTVKMEMASPL